MNQRSAMFLAVMCIFLATLLAALLVIYAPKRPRVAPLPSPKVSTTTRPPIFTSPAVSSPIKSPVRAPPTPEAVTTTVTVAPSTRPPALRAAGAMMALSVLWMLRATGLLYPLLALMSAIAFFVRPASDYIASERPSCGLQVVCDLAGVARRQLQMQVDISGLPEVSVKLLSGLLSNLERLNCDRMENCPNFSLSTVLPFL